MKINDFFSNENVYKENKIMISAFYLFYKFGFSRVTVKEICVAAKISKMTFYKYFQNKDELVLRLVSVIFDFMKKDLIRIMDSPKNLKDKFNDMAILKKDIFNMIGDEILKEIFIFEGLTDYITNFKEETWAYWENFIKKAQEQGTINPKIRFELIRFISDKISHLYETDQLKGMFENTEQMIFELNELFMYGLLARD